MKMPVSLEGISTYANVAKAKGEGDLKKACQQFESYLLGTVLKELQKSTGRSEKNFMEGTYFAMLNERVADFLAKKGVGITEMMMRYLENRGQPGGTGVQAEKQGSDSKVQDTNKSTKVFPKSSDNTPK